MSDESPRDALISDTTDALWAAFEADDNCYADSEMDVIDTSGADFSLYPIAASLIAALEFQGYTITRPVLREDQQ